MCTYKSQKASTCGNDAHTVHSVHAICIWHTAAMGRACCSGQAAGADALDVRGQERWETDRVDGAEHGGILLVRLVRVLLEVGEPPRMC